MFHNYVLVSFVSLFLGSKPSAYISVPSYANDYQRPTTNLINNRHTERVRERIYGIGYYYFYRFYSVLI